MKGWGAESSFPPSKVCFPGVAKGGTWDVLGIFAGIPESPRVVFFRKFVQKKFVLIFRPLTSASILAETAGKDASGSGPAHGVRPSTRTE